MPTVDELTARLSAIQLELDTLPPGPSAERYRLLLDQDAIREEARRIPAQNDAARTIPELDAELASLRDSRKSLVSDRSSYAMSKGGNNSGPASAAWVQLKQSAQAASGIDRLTVRIAQIEDELARRRSVLPPSE